MLAVFRWSAAFSILVVIAASFARADSSGTNTLQRELPVLWAAPPQGEYRFEGQAAIGYAVYFGGQDGLLRAMTPEGREIWRFKTGFGVHGAPAVDRRGTIYFGVFGHGLCALHPNGRLKWISEPQPCEGSSPAIGTDGTVFYLSHFHRKDRSRGPHLYAISPDGEERWRLPISGYIQDTKPAVGPDGTVYFSAWAGSYQKRRLLAVSPRGEIRWELADAGSNDPIVGPDGTVYVGTTDNEFLAVDADGQRRWSSRLPSPTSSPAVIAPGGRILVGTRDGYLHAFSATGQEEWVFETAEPLRYIDSVPPDYFEGRTKHPAIASSPVVLSNGETLVLGGATLHAVETNGKLSWTSRPASGFAAGITVDSAGRIFAPIATQSVLSNRFCALQGPSGVGASSWPCYGGNLRGSGRRAPGQNHCQTLPNWPPTRWSVWRGTCKSHSVGRNSSSGRGNGSRSSRPPSAPRRIG